MRILKIIWLVLTWSPLRKQHWSAKALNSLWCLGLFFLMYNTVCSDGVWNYKGSGFEGEKGIPTEKELTVPEWNAEPLDLGNGTCMIVKTHTVSTDCQY